MSHPVPLLRFVLLAFLSVPACAEMYEIASKDGPVRIGHNVWLMAMINLGGIGWCIWVVF